MEQRSVQIGDIAQITVQGQNYSLPIKKIDDQGIHTSLYLIVPQGSIWQVKDYSIPHTVAFIATKRFEKCGRYAETEVKSYEQLGSHPNFLEYYGSYSGPRGKCIVLEYLPHFNTFEEMFGSAPDNFLEIVTQSFTALDYLHSKGLIHGDLGSPVNILWDQEKNRVVIIDLEGGPITTPKDIIGDNRDLSLLLWIVLDGDIPQEIYEEIVNDDYEGFINYIETRRSMYSDPETQEAISIILNRFLI